METDPTSTLGIVLGLDPEGDTGQFKAAAGLIDREALDALASSIVRKATLPTADGLVHLVKVVVRLENLLPDVFGWMSTTPIPRLLAELKAHDRRRARDITIWAFHTSKNGYVPFGTWNGSRFSAGSVAEYEALESARWMRNHEANAARSAESGELATGRTSARSAERIRYNALRAAFIQELHTLQPVERIQRIALDSTFVIGSLPAEFADRQAASQLDAAEQEALLKRLAKAPKGPWQHLRIAIGAD